MQAWVDSYRSPRLRIAGAGLRARGGHAAAVRAPSDAPAGALLPGRPLLSSRQVAENHRQRIVFAAAELCARDGYSALTISEILRSSGVDTRVFHALFRDKADVLVAVHEMHFQRLMAVCTSAFFSAEEWPERVWRAGRAFHKLRGAERQSLHASPSSRATRVIRRPLKLLKLLFARFRCSSTTATVRFPWSTPLRPAYERRDHRDAVRAALSREPSFSPPAVVGLLPHGVSLISARFSAARGQRRSSRKSSLSRIHDPETCGNSCRSRSVRLDAADDVFAAACRLAPTPVTRSLANCGDRQRRGPQARSTASMARALTRSPTPCRAEGSAGSARTAERMETYGSFTPLISMGRQAHMGRIAEPLLARLELSDLELG